MKVDQPNYITHYEFVKWYVHRIRTDYTHINGNAIHNATIINATAKYVSVSSITGAFKVALEFQTIGQFS